jgi:hypothetical protein
MVGSLNSNAVNARHRIKHNKEREERRKSKMTTEKVTVHYYGSNNRKRTDYGTTNISSSRYADCDCDCDCDSDSSSIINERFTGQQQTSQKLKNGNEVDGSNINTGGNTDRSTKDSVFHTVMKYFFK